MNLWGEKHIYLISKAAKSFPMSIIDKISI